MKLQFIERTLAMASALACIISALIMCGQAVLAINPPQQPPSAATTTVAIEPCRK